MTVKYVHYLPGGGLGDVFREAYFHNAVGVLKRWKLENPRTELKLLLMGHNPAMIDLFYGQTWIDEVKLLEFPQDNIGGWHLCYQNHAVEFEGYTELRFNIPDARSNYRSDLGILRPRRRNVKTISAVGTAWQFVLTPEERDAVAAYIDRVWYHPYAGAFLRTIAPDTDEWLEEQFGTKWIRVGANYQGRETHEEEQGFSLPPRQLVAALRTARAVIGRSRSGALAVC